MRILFLAPFGMCEKQTLQRRLAPLAGAMAARGHEVQVLAAAWDCPQEADMWRRIAGVDVRWPAFGAGVAGVHPRLLRELHREIAAFAPDLLIVSKGLGYAGLALRWWLRQGGRAVLDVDDLEDVRGWGRRRNGLLRWALRRQEDRAMASAAGVIAASEFLAADVRARQPDQRILTLPNGLARAPERVRVEANAGVALLLTRGHDVDARRLAAVWGAVSQQVADAELVVAGGWRHVPPGLARATVRGWLDGAAYSDAIRGAALCFFLPEDKPLLRAKSPARLLDCLAHGLPVVTLDVGAYGALARAGGAVACDEAELVSLMVRLLRSPLLRATQGRHIWRQAERLSWPRRAAELDAWLAELF